MLSRYVVNLGDPPGLNGRAYIRIFLPMLHTHHNPPKIMLPLGDLTRASTSGWITWFIELYYCYICQFPHLHLKIEHIVLRGDSSSLDSNSEDNCTGVPVASWLKHCHYHKQILWLWWVLGEWAVVVYTCVLSPRLSELILSFVLPFLSFLPFNLLEFLLNLLCSFCSVFFIIFSGQGSEGFGNQRCT